MEPEFSLAYLQELATGRFTESGESSPHPYILFL